MQPSSTDTVWDKEVAELFFYLRDVSLIAYVVINFWRADYPGNPNTAGKLSKMLCGGGAGLSKKNGVLWTPGVRPPSSQSLTSTTQSRLLYSRILEAMETGMCS